MSITLKTLRLLSQDLSILFVEDDQILRQQTQAVFENIFKKVDISHNGQDALHQYQKYHDSTGTYYDILISDIEMPLLNGLELTHKILTINKRQKVIILSAHDDKKYLLDLIDLGVDAFLEKPMTSQKILQVLYKVCKTFQEDHILLLEEGFTYKLKSTTLLKNDKKVALTDNESKLLSLLILNQNQIFDYIDIFNHLYFEEVEKEFSQDSIKSLMKRLRKKLPKELISNTTSIGYYISL